MERSRFGSVFSFRDRHISIYICNNLMGGKIEIIDDVSFFLSLYKFFYLAFCSAFIHDGGKDGERFLEHWYSFN